MGKSVKKISKSTANVIKNPTNPKAYLDNGVTTLSGGLVDGTGGLNDMLFGKKVSGTPDSFVPLDPLQQKALGQYGKLLDEDTNKLADQSINAQLSGLSRASAIGENQVRQNALDAQRNAQSMVAQRGLGRSSVGLNAILNQTRDMGDKIGNVRADEIAQRNQIQAQAPLQKYNMRLSNLNAASGGINDILNTRIFKQGKEGGRSGGLAPLVGAGIGGLLGGSAGAQVGMGAGQYLQQSR